MPKSTKLFHGRLQIIFKTYSCTNIFYAFLFHFTWGKLLFVFVCTERFAGRTKHQKKFIVNNYTIFLKVDSSSFKEWREKICMAAHDNRCTPQVCSKLIVTASQEGKSLQIASLGCWSVPFHTRTLNIHTGSLFLTESTHPKGDNRS